MIIRPVLPSDAKELLAIYAPYVTDTTITFEYDIPSISEFTNRIKNKKYQQIFPIFSC